MSRPARPEAASKPAGRPAKPAADRLTYRIEEVATALGVSRRAIERERAAGRFPKPDLSIGRMPLWRTETVRDYLMRGGAR